MLKATALFAVLAIVSLLMQAAALGNVFDVLASVVFYISTVLALTFGVLGMLERAKD